MRCRRFQVAFSVLELLVASTLMMLGLFLASALLTEAAAQMSWSHRRASDPIVELAFEQLRVDVRGSRGAAVAGDVWNYGELGLVEHWSGEAVAFVLVDGQLLRRGDDSERPLLDSVGLFRWRRTGASSRALEIEIGFQETAPLTLRQGPTLREARPPIERRQSIVVTLRRAASSRY